MTEKSPCRGCIVWLSCLVNEVRAGNLFKCWACGSVFYRVYRDSTLASSYSMYLLPEGCRRINARQGVYREAGVQNGSALSARNSDTEALWTESKKKFAENFWGKPIGGGAYVSFGQDNSQKAAYGRIRRFLSKNVCKDCLPKEHRDVAKLINEIHHVPKTV